MNTLISQLKKIDTPTLSNAIERLKVRNNTTGFCDSSLKCLFPELGVMCGYAVTAEVETMNPVPEDVDEKRKRYLELCQAVEQSDKPVVVVMKEITAQPKFSTHCGDCTATILKRLGAVGLVSDSAVRDKSEVRALEFHYFAQGFVASHANFRVLRVQVPVTVCGISIAPGDLLHGDENGLISVPEQGREQLQKLAEEVSEKESKLREYVNSDQFKLEGL